MIIWTTITVVKEIVTIAHRTKTLHNLYFLFYFKNFVFINKDSLIFPLRLFLDMLFYSFFKSLVGKDVVIELKNDLSIAGTLHSVDQYLNVKLTEVQVLDPEKYPHIQSVTSAFVRGSVIRYIQLPPDDVDTQLLQEATRKEIAQPRKE
jgi:U6 snRNA-associated Sm-like protein LSm2